MQTAKKSQKLSVLSKQQHKIVIVKSLLKIYIKSYLSKSINTHTDYLKSEFQKINKTLT